MARPLSEAKRAALLNAAADAIAAEGIGVSTSRIARAAGVADGSLFLYFRTKDELLNQLYSSIKREIAASMFADYPSEAPLLERMRSVWMAYLAWGISNQTKRQAMSQLAVSHRINDEIREESMGQLREVESLLKQCLGARNGFTVAFAVAAMTTLSEVTIGFMTSESTKAAEYAEMGFAALMRVLDCES